jgi:hypothetical protein
MRRVVCYRIVRARGFFWGRRLFLYRRRTAGHLAPAGLGSWPRRGLWAMGDGFFIRRGLGLRARQRRRVCLRFKNAGRVQLWLTTPRVEPI